MFGNTYYHHKQQEFKAMFEEKRKYFPKFLSWFYLIISDPASQREI